MVQIQGSRLLEQEMAHHVPSAALLLDHLFRRPYSPVLHELDQFQGPDGSQIRFTLLIGLGGDIFFSVEVEVCYVEDSEDPEIVKVLLFLSLMCLLLFKHRVLVQGSRSVWGGPLHCLFIDFIRLGGYKRRRINNSGLNP